MFFFFEKYNFILDIVDPLGVIINNTITFWKQNISDTETTDNKTQCESEKSSLSNEKEEEGKIYLYCYICFVYNIYLRTIFLT